MARATAIGLMSGTSYDGVDVALIETDGEGNLTDRQVGGLHESLLSMDPSGREGKPA